jgi:hypothetical protein
VLRIVVASISIALSTCACARSTGTHAGEPAPRATEAPSAATVDRDEPHVPSRPAPVASSDAAAAPVVRGTGARDGGVSEKPCAARVVLDRLRDITRACQQASHEVCGKVSLVRGEKATDVRVTFDLTSTAGAEAFSRCVAARINDVTWRCAMDSPAIELDLDCRL